MALRCLFSMAFFVVAATLTGQTSALPTINVYGKVNAPTEYSRNAEFPAEAFPASGSPASDLPSGLFPAPDFQAANDLLNNLFADFDPYFVNDESINQIPSSSSSEAEADTWDAEGDPTDEAFDEEFPAEAERSPRFKRQSTQGLQSAGAALDLIGKGMEGNLAFRNNCMLIPLAFAQSPSNDNLKRDNSYSICSRIDCYAFGWNGDEFHDPNEQAGRRRRRTRRSPRWKIPWIRGSS